MSSKITYIYTDPTDIESAEMSRLEEFINESYGDKSFIICEDNTNLLTTDSEDALIAVEYVDMN